MEDGLEEGTGCEMNEIEDLHCAAVNGKLSRARRSRRANGLSEGLCEPGEGMISEMTAPASCGAALPSHVGARPSRSRGGLERRVWCLLKRAVPAERQRLLRHLSEPQRRALERWILAHPEAGRG
ncbi:unnamed protein product [Durusdinium trenchii]|uniref:Uncharacterized protein n=1 Tax=Durusdinium trenchii TaxID=1381693 RepID=A0ABP0I2E1_9DINO